MYHIEIRKHEVGKVLTSDEYMALPMDEYVCDTFKDVVAFLGDKIPRVGCGWAGFRCHGDIMEDIVVTKACGCYRIGGVV